MTKNQGNEPQDGLIGHTGFVGGILSKQSEFSGHFNSANISKIGETRWDTLVCAAAPGSMFQANKFPDQDQAQIEALINQLKHIKAKRFVLISSIAVLEDFSGADDEGTTSFQQALAYGRHRRQLERFVEQHFSDSLVVRLPALFGHGLRKNFIFDLLNPIPAMLPKARLDALGEEISSDLKSLLARLYAHDPVTDILKVDRAKLARDPQRAALESAVMELGFSATQFHNPQTTYQYYDMSRLWTDIEIATQAGLSHIHLVSEPLKAARIHQRLTGQPMPETVARVHHEDMRTRYAGLWQEQGPYLVDAETTLERLAAFFTSERSRG